MSVLVGYVSTPEGEAALQTAIAEARLRETSLVVLNASSGDAIADPHHVSPDVVARIDKELADFGVAHSIEVRSGRDPVDEIVTLAEESQAHLVVIGLRRRNPVGKLLTGSTAQQILHDVDCPVLAVKAARKPAVGPDRHERHIWIPRDRAESIATIHAALDAGITLRDTGGQSRPRRRLSV